MALNKTKKYIVWSLQILAAVILLQTLYFKFSAAPESVYIFTRLGVEPWGRVGSGCVELVAGVLLLTGRYAWLGAVISLGIISGAILSHFTILGIEIMGDHGQLFIYALIVFFSSLGVLWFRRGEVPYVSAMIEKRTVQLL